MHNESGIKQLAFQLEICNSSVVVELTGQNDLSNISPCKPVKIEPDMQQSCQRRIHLLLHRQAVGNEGLPSLSFYD